MRLWHWLFLIWMTAITLTVCREPIGRVAVIVFITGLIEIVLGTTAIMTLFRTLGAIGEARRITAYAEAVLATMLVLVVASISMNAVFAVGIRLAQRVIP